jgi:hypothetical protein
MASFIYNSFKEYSMDGTVDLDGDTFKVALLTSAHSPDAANTQWSNISGNEVADGNGYAAGGQTLQNVSWARVGGTVTFDADDPVWSSATFDASYAVIYDDTSANDVLVALIDFGGQKSVSNGTFTVHFHDDGIFTVS